MTQSTARRAPSIPHAYRLSLSGSGSMKALPSCARAPASMLQERPALNACAVWLALPQTSPPRNSAASNLTMGRRSARSPRLDPAGRALKRGVSWLPLAGYWPALVPALGVLRRRDAPGIPILTEVGATVQPLASQIVAERRAPRSMFEREDGAGGYIEGGMVSCAWVKSVDFHSLPDGCDSRLVVGSRIESVLPACCGLSWMDASLR